MNTVFASFYCEIREEYETLNLLLDCIEKNHGAGAGHRGHLPAPLMLLDTKVATIELFTAIQMTPEQAASGACLKILGDLVSELAVTMRFQFERDAAEVSDIVSKYKKWTATEKPKHKRQVEKQPFSPEFPGEELEWIIEVTEPKRPRLDPKSSDTELRKLEKALKKLQASVQEITLPEEQPPSQSVQTNPNQQGGAKNDFLFGDELEPTMNPFEKMNEPPIDIPIEAGRTDPSGSAYEPPTPGGTIEPLLPDPDGPTPVSPINQTGAAIVQTPPENITVEPSIPDENEVLPEPPSFTTPPRNNNNPAGAGSSAQGSRLQLPDLDEEELTEQEQWRPPGLQRPPRRRRPVLDMQHKIPIFDIKNAVRSFNMSWNNDHAKNQLTAEQRAHIDCRVNRCRSKRFLEDFYSKLPMGHRLGRTLCEFLNPNPHELYPNEPNPVEPNHPIPNPVEPNILEPNPPRNSPESQSQKFNRIDIFETPVIQNAPIMGVEQDPGEGSVEPAEQNAGGTNQLTVPAVEPPLDPVYIDVTPVEPGAGTIKPPLRHVDLQTATSTEVNVTAVEPTGINEDPITDPKMAQYIQALRISDLESLLIGGAGPFYLDALYPRNTTSKYFILRVFEKLLQLQMDGNLRMKQDEPFSPITIITHETN